MSSSTPPTLTAATTATNVATTTPASAAPAAAAASAATGTASGASGAGSNRRADRKQRKDKQSAAVTATTTSGGDAASDNKSAPARRSRSPSAATASIPDLTPEQEKEIDTRTNQIWAAMRISTVEPPKVRILCPQCGVSSRYYCPACKIPLAPADPTAAATATTPATAAAPAPVATASTVATVSTVVANSDAKSVPANAAAAKVSRPQSTPPSAPPVAGVIRSPVASFRLPIDLDVIHHPKEHVQKSTAMHGRVLCPQQITIHEYPNVPDYDIKTTCLLYPVNATPVSEAPVHQFKKAVFIDSTWAQSKGMKDHPVLSKLPRLAISAYATRFWRFQTGEPKTSLATLEAMYFFAREYDQRLRVVNHTPTPYAGEFDNLLFYYQLMYSQIQSHYAANPQRKFTTKHYSGYIKYDENAKTNTPTATATATAASNTAATVTAVPIASASATSATSSDAAATAITKK